MQNEFFEKMTDLSKVSYNAIQELTSINSKALKELSELQMGLATFSMESGAELTKTLGVVTNYKDVMTVEVDFANEYGTKVMEFNRKATDVLTGSRNEVVSWIEKTAEEATTEAAPAPKKARKKVAA